MFGKGSMARPQINCDAGIFVAGSTGHLGSTEDRAPSPIVMFGQGPSSTSTLISIKIMEESSMELGGSTLTLPSGDRAIFFEQRTCIRCHRLLEDRFDDSFGVIVRIESTIIMQNLVEFRWRNPRQSTIYRSPVKSGWESGRV